MPEVAKVVVPVFTFLVEDAERVYLQRRYNTGYLDGYYEPPAGKLDLGEFPVQTACRETQEEAGVVVAEEDLELFHSYANITGGIPWLGLFFRTHRWNGEPSIQEPHKCDDGGWFDLQALPHLTPQVSDAIGLLLTAQTIGMSEYTNIRSNSA